jgi:hypothetical protein
VKRVCLGESVNSPKGRAPLGKIQPENKVEKLPNDVSTPWKRARWFLERAPISARRRRSFGEERKFRDNTCYEPREGTNEPRREH